MNCPNYSHPKECLKKNVSWLFLFFLFINYSYAQTNQENCIVTIKVQFGGKPLQLDSLYISKRADTLRFSALKFYVSNFQIKYVDNTFTNESNSYHLIDIENPETLKITLKKDPAKKMQSIKFAVGVDSIANVSGAMGGDLDPIHGMYWAWQSGYVNFKIEGSSPSCNTRKNKFQFHIGGYLAPFYSMRIVEIIPVNNDLNLVFDLSELFSNIDLKETNTIMIPGKEAMSFSGMIPKIIKVE